MEGRDLSGSMESFDSHPLPAELEEVFDRAVNGKDHEPSRALSRRSDEDDFIEAALDRAVGNEPATKPLKRKNGTDNVDALLDRALDAMLGPDDDAPAPAKAKPRRLPRPSFDHATVQRHSDLLAHAKVTAQQAYQTIGQWQSFVAAVQAQFPYGQPNAQTDPIGYQQYKAVEETAQRSYPAVQQAWQQAEHARIAAWSEMAAAEDELFEKNNPGASSDPELVANVQAILNAAGIPTEAVVQMWNTGAAGVSIADRRAEPVLISAAMYATGQKPKDYEAAGKLVARYLSDIVGVSDEEIAALAAGAPVSLREHRVQQVLHDAARFRMQSEASK